MAIAIKGEKKAYYVFEIKQDDYENGFQTLSIKGATKDMSPGVFLSWTETWKYDGNTHEVFGLLREEETSHGKAISDHRIYNKYLQHLGKCVDDTFYEQLIKKRNTHLPS